MASSFSALGSATGTATVKAAKRRTRALMIRIVARSFLYQCQLCPLRYLIFPSWNHTLLFIPLFCWIFKCSDRWEVAVYVIRSFPNILIWKRNGMMKELSRLYKLKDLRRRANTRNGLRRPLETWIGIPNYVTVIKDCQGSVKEESLEPKGDYLLRRAWICIVTYYLIAFPPTRIVKD